MGLVLVTLEGNYADEFDFDGISIMQESDYDELMELVDEHSDSELYFGTNEGVEVGELSFSSEPITDEEVNVIEKFGLDGTGLLTPDEVLDRLGSR